MTGVSNEDDNEKTVVLRRPPVAAARPAAARLVCLDTSYLREEQASLEIPLGETEVTIGRDAGNSITIVSDEVSRMHARLFPQDGSWGIEDRGSTNGIRVNKALVERAVLKPGDRVDLGRIPFYFECEAAAPRRVDEPVDDGEARTMVIKRRPAELGAPARAARAAASPVEPPARAGARAWIAGLVVLALAGGAFTLLMR